MKKLTLAAAIASLGLSMNAMAVDWFAGVHVGQSFDHVKVSGADDLTRPDEPVTYGLRGGAILNDNVRVYGTYLTGSDSKKQNGVETEMNQNQLLLSADYVFDKGMLKPFIGATLGYDQTEYKVSGDNAFKKDQGKVAFGAQAGFMTIFGNVSLEGGYRHLWHDTNISNDGIRIKNTRDGNLYAALNYRF